MSTLRKKYLEAVLKQDVGFFDTDARTGDIVFSVSTDTLLVQDAISEKVVWFGSVVSSLCHFLHSIHHSLSFSIVVFFPKLPSFALFVLTAFTFLWSPYGAKSSALGSFGAVINLQILIWVVLVLLGFIVG